MSWTNYHSHCHYCDGKYEPEQYIKSAMEKGIFSYGFSSHAPVPFDCTWTMKAEAAPKYVAEVNALKQQYEKKIQLYCGLEIDYIPGIAGPKSKPILDLGLDYTVGSIHFVDAFPDGRFWEIDGSHQVFLDGLHQIFGGDSKSAIKRYFELTRQMVEQECPDIIGHIDKIKIQDEEGKLFSTQEQWYQKEIVQTLQIIADAGAMIEVNTRGIYKKKTIETYPGKWILEQIHKLGIPITLNSDAHHPDEIISNFQEAASLLTSIGFQHLHILMDGTWQRVKFNKDGLEI
jgi:histidinol-phosphatase (PHP family)